MEDERTLLGNAFTDGGYLSVACLAKPRLGEASDGQPDTDRRAVSPIMFRR